MHQIPASRGLRLAAVILAVAGVALMALGAVRAGAVAAADAPAVPS